MALSLVRRIALAFGVVCAFALSGCELNDQLTADTTGAPVVTAPASASLYERLGGMPAIQAVVDQTIVNIGNDPRINQFFLVDLDNLNRMLVEQICDLSGGPCEYSGENMRDAHDHLALTDAHFDALVEDLVAALNQFDVPAQEQSELLAPLAAMRDDVLNR